MQRQLGARDEARAAQRGAQARRKGADGSDGHQRGEHHRPGRQPPAPQRVRAERRRYALCCGVAHQKRSREGDGWRGAAVAAGAGGGTGGAPLAGGVGASAFAARCIWEGALLVAASSARGDVSDRDVKSRALLTRCWCRSARTRESCGRCVASLLALAAFLLPAGARSTAQSAARAARRSRRPRGLASRTSGASLRATAAANVDAASAELSRVSCAALHTNLATDAASSQRGCRRGSGGA